MTAARQLALGFAPPSVGGPHSRRGALPTSEQAAQAIAPGVTDAQAAVLRVLQRGPCTADEIALYVGRTVLYVRPRVSELRHAGLVEATGERRRNTSGQSAAVMRLTHAGRRALMAVA
jgi:predicted ArsR family transcriptional regulator